MLCFQETRKSFFAKITQFVLVVAFLVGPLNVFAATLAISPGSGSYPVGTTFSASFFVSSANQSVNAASGSFSFSKENLEIVSSSKVGSIFSLWVQEPSYSNSSGTGSFEGVITNPGFTGNTGKLVSYTFRVKAAGTGTIKMLSSSVLANDGNGTNVLSGSSNASFTLSNVELPKPVEPVIDIQPAPTVVDGLLLPKVSSSSHPDSLLWYPNTDARLLISLGRDVTGVQTLFDSQPDSVPQGKAEKPFAERVLKNIKEGVSYFHIRSITRDGTSEVVHFPIRIDSTEPTELVVTLGRNTKNDLVATVSAKDAVSGMDYYQIVLDNKEPEKIIAQGNAVEYVLPRALSLGTHTLTVTAYDKARNKKEVKVNVDIDVFAPPNITTSPGYLFVGGTMKIIGEQGAPAQDMYVFVKKPNMLLETYLVSSDEQGSFLVKDHMDQAGIYEIWAEGVGDTHKNMIPMSHTRVHVHGKVFLWIYHVINASIPLVVLVIIFVLFTHLRSKVKTKKKAVSKLVSDME